MKQVLIRRGHVVVEDVPAPAVEPGTVLVRVTNSCISAGTELSGIRASATPLWKRAVRQPVKVKHVAEMALAQGVGQTRSIIAGKVGAGEPTGYSAAGVTIAVGVGVNDVQRGDRVACAGSQSAHHAEVIRIPRNLAVRVPDSVTLADASTVTLGAIALQGVRRAMPTLGESFVVVGLGVIGQLTAQLLRANGCRVIGVDLDSQRTQLASSLGMDIGLDTGDGDAITQVARLTDGVGADGVIVTAANPSDAVISSAFHMCRRKGRVVLVGDVGLHLNRADMYEKELDFLISTSYGPGRYDRAYEEEGVDYPIGYVRWTENRNMAEYLRLVSLGSVRLGPLVGATFQIDDASRAYEALAQADERPLVVLLDYPEADPIPERVVPNPSARAGKPGALRVALVGAGGFAKGTHLPNLQALSSDFQLHAVVSRTGHNATAAAKQYGARYGTTDYEHVLQDEEVDVVIVTTRHDLHAGMALAALRSGKHVLVEKPLALTQAELDEIVAFYDRAGQAAPLLLTGFNRRFSSYARRIAEITANRTNPMVLNYRMNAGYIAPGHWVHTSEGGGRNRGEACHIYDLFTFLTGSRVVDVTARSLRPATAYYCSSDNFVATVNFDDGSIGSLTYTALGAPEFPKEQLEVFVDGAVISLDDYRTLTVVGASGQGLSSRRPEKGQREELSAMARAIRDGGEWPIPLWQQAQATEIALRVESFVGTSE